MNAASLIPAAPPSMLALVGSYDVQEDDLARENRLSSRCWSCDEPKGEAPGVDCAAKAVHS